MQGTLSHLSHHVYFWLKNPASSADKARLLQGVQTLTAIPSITGFHIGTPAATEDREVIDSSYAVSWLAFFASEADEQGYQVHPIHLKFIADCEDLWSKVVVYDSLNTAG